MLQSIIEQSDTQSCDEPYVKEGQYSSTNEFMTNMLKERGLEQTGSEATELIRRHAWALMLFSAGLLI